MFDYCKQKLGWLGFCQAAFPAQECQMTDVDYLRYSWKCLLKLHLTTDMTCSLSDDWRKICKAHKLNICDTMKLGVTQQCNNTVIYMSPPPMMVLRTNLPPSKDSILSGHVFTVEQYFWMNWFWSNWNLLAIIVAPRIFLCFSFCVIVSVHLVMLQSSFSFPFVMFELLLSLFKKWSQWFCCSMFSTWLDILYPWLTLSIQWVFKVLF